MFCDRVSARPRAWDSAMAAADGSFYGRRTDLPSQSGMSGIEDVGSTEKTLLKMTLKMSRGKKMTSWVRKLKAITFCEPCA